MEILREIGLSEEESKVYLALLKEGSSLASTISDLTKINRSHSYKILDELIKKGFVSYVLKENVRYYNPVSPEKILEIIKEKETKLKEELPRLNQLFNPTKNKPEVEILEGEEGIKTVLKDILKTKEEWLAFGSGKSPEVLSYYSDHFEKERVKNKIFMKAILDKSKSGIERGNKLSKLKYTNVKYLKGEGSSPSSNWIYGENVAIITWTKENPFAIRITSKEVSESYKRYFNTLWKTARS